MRATSLLPALLLAASVSAHAQSAPSAQSTPAATTQPSAAEQAARAELNQKMSQAALQVAQMIDAGKIGEVWDGSSAVARQAASRADFVQQIGADRKTLGPQTARRIAGVGLTQSDGSNKQLPAGIYANVALNTRFTNATEPIRELVSFHLDDDKVWRLAGYTLR